LDEEFKLDVDIIKNEFDREKENIEKNHN